jgi:hypothetical protein
MRLRPSGRFWLVNLVSLAVVLAVFVFARRPDQSGGQAWAAPAIRPTPAIGDAGIPALDANAVPAVDGATEASAESPAAASADPIDTAIAPDGGVPRQPGGTQYRSPFAQANAGQAIRIKVGMLLNTVDDYDVKTGTFTADFFLSLTSQVSMPTLNLSSPNGKLDSKEVIADKPTFKLYRFVGQFKSPADLRKYPFDSQALKILLEDDIRGTDQLRFVVDKEHTQLGRGFRAVGWQVDYVEARSISQSYPDRFEGDDLYYGRYAFTLGLERFATSAAFKVFVPAFVIVIIALLGMWVPPDKMEVRSNAGAPMLAGAVLFHFALMQELPATSYLTRADKLMLGVYTSLAIGMISTWCMFLVKSENTMVVFRVSRIVVPIVTAIVMALGCFV